MPSNRCHGPRGLGIAALLLHASATLPAPAQALPIPLPSLLIPSAPPPNPPTGIRPTPPLTPTPTLASASATPAAGELYSIGDPTDEEQLYVEFLNRARAHPQDEVERYITTTDPDVIQAYAFFNVDLALLRSQFASITVCPPLSINARLTEAARIHTRDMLDHAFQGHDGTDGTDPGQRITRAGYSWQRYGENVYSNAESVWQGHVAFDVDWGFDAGGMQVPPGHRNTIHNPAFREVGVGVLNGNNTKDNVTVGPQLVTQDFATAFNPDPMVTGVVHFDFNGNEFYDLGEGIGGVRVSIDGVPTRAVTARSGGFSIPVSGNGTYTVRFAVPGIVETTQTVTVANNNNVKVDHRPTYSPPVIGGTSVAYLNRDNLFPFAPVPAATSYQWLSLRSTPWLVPDGAETTPGRFTAQVSPGYSVVANDVRQLGSASYHLAHPAPPTDQFLSLDQPILLGTDSALTFGSRLGWAGAGETARAQVSTDSGRSWVDVWSQVGAGNSGQSSFQPRTISLAQYAGQTVQLRFAYTYTAGKPYFPQATTAGVGWYLDEILVTNAMSLGDETISDAGPGSFTFRPAAEGQYQLQVRAAIGDRVLSWGPNLGVTAQAGGPVDPDPPSIRLGSLTPSLQGGWVLDLQLLSGAATVFEVETTSALDGIWNKEPGASVSPTGSPGHYQAVLPASTATTRFVRVVAR